jgi:hypothetical protein
MGEIFTEPSLYKCVHGRRVIVSYHLLHVAGTHKHETRDTLIFLSSYDPCTNGRNHEVGGREILSSTNITYYD